MNRRLAIIPLSLFIIINLLAVLVPSGVGSDETPINGGDTAWLLAATCLVLLMTPGLAFFYGGMVNRPNVISRRCKVLWQCR